MRAPPEHVPTTCELTWENGLVLEDFPFQRGVERLRQRVVRARPDCSHRLGDTESFTQLPVSPRGIDAAMIGVENGPVKVASDPVGHRESFFDQLRAHVVSDRETGQLPRIAVDDGGQVHIRPVRDRQVRDIADVDGVRFLRDEPAFQQVGQLRSLFRRHGGLHPAFFGVAEQAHLAHQPGGALVIEKVVVGWIGVDGRRHAFRPVTTVLGREHGLDPRSQHRVVKDASPAGRSSRFPFVIRGPVDLQNLT